MFKRSRRKIVASIMTILVALWVGTLGVIYASSYFEMKKQNEEMLRAHAEMYTLQQSAIDFPTLKPRPNENHFFEHRFDPESPQFQLSVFYSVAISYDGNVLEIKNGMEKIQSDESLEKLAENIIKSEKISGTKNNLSFYTMDKGGYILVAFMDNTVVNESASTLFRYTLIFGGAALILFFFLSVYLAKRIVQPLEENDQKQKQFISDAGHELKTPISVVSANAELLTREIGENKWLQNIQYENERMATLIRQFLDLARAENKTPLMERIDFSRLVAGEALPFESVAFEKGLVLSCDIASDIEVEGNSTQLKQVVSILLDNAIRHGTEGDVKLFLKKERGSAYLSVINKGEAISEENLEKIFERFYRLDSSRNSASGHYGLGLSIAKAIAASHKGRIEVKCYHGLVEFSLQIPSL